MPPEKKLSADNRVFSFSVAPEITSEVVADKTKRKFAGVAYSGNVINDHWYWGNVVFDLSSITVAAKLPALIDHDRAQRCGYVTESSISNETGLSVAGNLLSNASGQAVANDSDEGFPWQMSVHIEPASVEEFGSGTTVNVNGQTFNGPITVFRNSKIIEVSLTATGWDGDTSAVAMSRGNKPESTNQEDTTMDLAQAQARITELENANTGLQASLDTANTALTAFSQQVRDGEVKQLFSDIGREYKADDENVKAFSVMPKDAFELSAKLLREQSATQPSSNDAQLYGHTATGGQNQLSNGAVNPLMADAEKRQAQFSRK